MPVTHPTWGNKAPGPCVPKVVEKLRWVVVASVASVVLASGCAGGSAPTPPSAPARSTGPSVAAADDGATAKVHRPQDVIDSPRAHVIVWGIDKTGARVALWQRGWPERPRLALAVRDRDGTNWVRWAPPGAGVHLGAQLRRGWLVEVGRLRHRRVERLDTHARLHPVPRSTRTVTPAAGDVPFVGGGGRVSVYRDGRLLAVPRLPMRLIQSAYVTPTGALVVVGGNSDTVRRWCRMAGWVTTCGGWPGSEYASPVAGHGDHVAFALARVPDGEVDATPLAGLAVSDDGGNTWRPVTVPNGLVETLSLAVTRDGTVYATTGGGPTIRVRPGADRASLVRSATPIVLDADGRQLHALDAPGRHWNRARGVVSSDGGRHWTVEPLPGR